MIISYFLIFLSSSLSGNWFVSCSRLYVSMWCAFFLLRAHVINHEKDAVRFNRGLLDELECVNSLESIRWFPIACEESGTVISVVLEDDVERPEWSTVVKLIYRHWSNVTPYEPLSCFQSTLLFTLEVLHRHFIFMVNSRIINWSERTRPQ